MNIRNLALLAPMTLMFAGGCDASGTDATPVADHKKAVSCGGCHKGAMSFKGKDAAALAETIKAIRDGERGHPPLKLDDNSDEAIDDLAAELTAK